MLVINIFVFIFLGLLLQVLETSIRQVAYNFRAFQKDNVSKNLRVIIEHSNDYIYSLYFFRVMIEILLSICVVLFFLEINLSIWAIFIFTILLLMPIFLVLIGILATYFASRWAWQIANFGIPLIKFFNLMSGPIPIMGNFLLKTFPINIYKKNNLGRDLSVLFDQADREQDGFRDVKLIKSVVELRGTRVREVMVPRTDMVTISVDTSLDSAMRVFSSSGFSRIPIIGGHKDDIVGILYFKDLVNEIYRYNSVDTDISKLVRSPIYVPESKAARELLKDMQTNSIHLAIVVDEYGGTAGLITMEDILEEIVGEIVDEYDNDQPAIDMFIAGKYRVSLRVSVDDFADFFGIDLEEEVETVGGLFARILGEIPRIDSIAYLGDLLLASDHIVDRFGAVKYVIVSKNSINNLENGSE